jgi:hypothetical protein
LTLFALTLLAGVNDPYVLIELGRDKFVTRTLQRAEAPEWNEQCSLRAFLDRYALIVANISNLPRSYLHKTQLSVDTLSLKVITLNILLICSVSVAIRTLQLSVWHKGGSFEKDRYLGRCSFPLSTIGIYDPPKRKWFTLLPREVLFRV